MDKVDRERIIKLATTKHGELHRVMYGIAKKMGHAYYPWANLSSVMYGGGRTVATIKHVRKHWTVKMVDRTTEPTQFKYKADALLFIANELGL